LFYVSRLLCYQEKDVYQTISLRWADTSKSVAKFVAKRCSLLDVKLHTFCGYMTSCSCMFLQLIMSSTNSRDKLTLESSDWCHTWFVIFNTASKTEARQDDCSKNLTFDCLEMFWKRGEHEYHIYWNSDHMWYKKVPVPKERHEWGLASDGITLSVLKKIPWDRFQWTKFMPSCKTNSYRRTQRGVREEWAE
jgi:hypothetical protein